MNSRSWCRGSCVPAALAPTGSPPKQLPGEPRRVTRSQRRPAVRHVEPDGGQPVEDPRAAEPGGAQLVSQTAVKRIADWPAGVEQRPRSQRGSRKRRLPGRCHPSSGEIFFPRAVGKLLVAREIETAAVVIALQVLPEIGQLQCSTHVVRPAIKLRAVMSRNPEHESANRIGRAAAVVQHVRPRRIAGHIHVLTEGAQQIVEQRDGQRAGSDSGADGAENRHRVRRLTRLRRWT